MLGGIEEKVNVAQSIWCIKDNKEVEAGKVEHSQKKEPGKLPPSLNFNFSVGNGELLEVSMHEHNMFQPGIFKSITIKGIWGEKQPFETGRPFRRQ